MHGSGSSLLLEGSIVSSVTRVPPQRVRLVGQRDWELAGYACSFSVLLEPYVL